jgi:hypothetical protein
MTKSIVFVHRGLAGAETMVTEYIGKVERYMKQKGYSLKEELGLLLKIQTILT